MLRCASFAAFSIIVTASFLGCGDDVPPTVSSRDTSSGSGSVVTMCAPNSTRACYAGPASSKGVGMCVGGIETCNAKGDTYSACEGEVLPKIEDCATPADESCDGASCGEVLWNKSLGSVASSSPGLAEWGGDIVAASTFVKQGTAGAMSGLGYVRLDASGNEIETRDLALGGLSLGVKMVPAADGTLLLGADAINQDLGAGPISGYLSMKLDANGARLWTTSFGSQFGSNTLSGFAANPAGNVMLAGESDNAFDVAGKTMGAGAFVVAMSSADGAPLAARSFATEIGYPLLDVLADGRAAIATGEGIHLINQVLEDTCFAALPNSTWAALAALPDGGVVGARYLPTGVELQKFSSICAPAGSMTIPAQDAVSSLAIEADPDGGIFLSIADGDDHVVMRLSSTLAEVWTKRFPAVGLVGALMSPDIELLGKVWPVVAIVGPIDYGNGPLGSGLEIARIAP